MSVHLMSSTTNSKVASDDVVAAGVDAVEDRPTDSTDDESSDIKETVHHHKRSKRASRLQLRQQNKNSTSSAAVISASVSTSNTNCSTDVISCSAANVAAVAATSSTSVISASAVTTYASINIIQANPRSYHSHLHSDDLPDYLSSSGHMLPDNLHHSHRLQMIGHCACRRCVVYAHKRTSHDDEPLGHCGGHKGKTHCCLRTGFCTGCVKARMVQTMWKNKIRRWDKKLSQQSTNCCFNKLPRLQFCLPFGGHWSALLYPWLLLTIL